MMKNIKNLGKILSKIEQRKISGGDEREVFRTVCEEPSCCYTVLEYSFDRWVHKEVCYGGSN